MFLSFTVSVFCLRLNVSKFKMVASRGQKLTKNYFKKLIVYAHNETVVAFIIVFWSQLGTIKSDLDTNGRKLFLPAPLDLSKPPRGSKNIRKTKILETILFRQTGKI